jgi:hypothetical protein
VKRLLNRGKYRLKRGSRFPFQISTQPTISYSRDLRDDGIPICVIINDAIRLDKMVIDQYNIDKISGELV